MDSRAHWDRVYQEKSPDAVSWFQPTLHRSLECIDDLSLPTTAHIADIGGGASTLVDDLLARGFQQVSVLDLSAHALQHSQERLDAPGEHVRWIEGSATDVHFEKESVDLWHDRAVFHFLTEDAQRQHYHQALLHSLRPGGHVILATFSPNGPAKCSGLPIRKHSARALFDFLGEAFEPIAHALEEHETPWQSQQEFTYIIAKKR